MMRFRSYRHSIERLLSSWQAILWPKLSSVLGWIVVLYLSATMLLRYDKDTTDVSGTAFVAVAVLAGLAFTYAGVLSETGRDRGDIIYAGERLCQGAMLFLVASLLKYGTIVIPVQVAALPIVTNATSAGQSNLKWLVTLLQIFLFLVFMNGLLASQLGYTILGRVVMRRMSRRGKQDVYFPPPQ